MAIQTTELQSKSEAVQQTESLGLPGGLKISDAVFALSLANLCFSQAWFELLYDADFGYYNKIPVTRTTLLALWLNIGALALAVCFGIALLRRYRSPVPRVGGQLVLLALLLPALNFARLNVFHVEFARFLKLIHFVKPLGAALIGLLAGGALIWWRDRVAQATRAGVIILCPLALITFGKGAWWLLDPPAAPVDPPPTRASETPASAAHPGVRVVWILFDEFDQRLAFSERPPGLELPELDRLYANCFHATNAFPPGGVTLISLPALIGGRSVDKVAPESASELAVTWTGSPGPVGWSTQPNVFSRAGELGVKSAAVGWYHPYSRLFGSLLEDCFWKPYPTFEQARGETLTASVVEQLWSTTGPLQERRLQIQLYRQCQAHARDMAVNPQYGLVFLHLAVPHKPGIYEPTTQQFSLTQIFSRPEQYENNLCLTDRALGELRRDLERTGLWDHTWLVISSDHFWREAPAYDGKMDHRVPFIIKAPGANQPAVYARDFNTVVTSDLVLAMLRREITRAEELAPWLNQHHVEPPREYDLSTWME